MRLADKIAALLQARRPRPRSQAPQYGGPEGENAPTQRPTPMEEKELPLDPAEAWGIVLQPRDKMIQYLNDFIEQLALESFLNGPAFEFTHQELEPRFLSFFERLVEKGDVSPGSDEYKGKRIGVKRWIQAQKIRIGRLVAWWSAQGGPDIEARVL